MPSLNATSLKTPSLNTTSLKTSRDTEFISQDEFNPLSPVVFRRSDAPIPANMAVWILIAAELTEFALFFVIYLVVRSHNPEIFSQGPERLNLLAGTLNTLALITSSYFVARAISAIKMNKPKQTVKWLGASLLMGASYLGIKTWEYYWNAQAGLDSRTDLFYTLYYYLTFNHLLHVLMGMCTLAWVAVRAHYNAYNKDEYQGLESAACYWHMIDLAWIIIFPLLYVLR